MQLNVQQTPQVTIPIQKAAEMLGLSHWTLRRMVAQGKVIAVKLNKRVMIEAEEIQRLIERSRLAPRGFGPAAAGNRPKQTQEARR